MREVIINLFGSYTPEIVEVLEGDIVKEVVVPDYEYIAGIFLFALVTYCVFRLIGGMFGGFKR
ncbi:MAG: hypothetical protein EOM59_09970 [Clostridia bacterium]|nr:hypothetical protein [Clostridia bacterium]